MQRHAEEGARIIDRLGFLQRRGAGDPPPPRALRRHGLPGPARGRGDPARRADHPRRGRARLDADDAHLPRRPPGRTRRSPSSRTRPGTQFCPRCVGALERILPLESIVGDLPRPRRAGPQLVAVATAARTPRDLRFSSLLYHSWHGPQAALPGGRRDRPGGARRLPGRNPQALLRRADPRRAAGVRGAARALADDAGVRGRRGDDGAPADGDRALRHAGTPPSARRASCRAASRRARSCSGCCGSSGRSSAAPPTARDIDEHKGEMPSKSLYWHTFGSLANALREAGFDVPVGEERLERAVEQGIDARPDARPAAEVRRLGGRRASRTTRC